MDQFAATGRRSAIFLVTGSATPRLLVSEGVRQAVVFVNESSTLGVRIGPSGTNLAIAGLYIPPSQSFVDNYTMNDWWVVGSGTNISGFIVS